VLNEFEKIFLVYDSDSAGQKGALEAGKRLGLERCYNVVLPAKDVNDFFKFGGLKSELDKLLTEAKPISIPEVHSVLDLFQLSELEQKEEGLELPWVSLRKLTKKLLPGFIVIVQAIPKTGKTTFCVNALAHWALQGVPSLVYCLEMRDLDLLRRLVCADRSVPLEQLEHTDYVVTKGRFYDAPLYFCCSMPDEPNRVFNTIQYAVKRFGVKVVVFDNLHFLCRSLDHVVTEIGVLSKTFKALAMKLGIVIFIVVQPRKVDPFHVPDLYDMRDSSSLPADCDLALSLWRKPMFDQKVSEDDYKTTSEYSFDPYTIVRIAGSRFAAGGQAVLFCRGEFYRFDDCMGEP
jgi:replicative DNA helicase